MGYGSLWRDRAGIGLTDEDWWKHHRRHCFVALANEEFLDRLRAAVMAGMAKVGEAWPMPECLCLNETLTVTLAVFVADAVCSDFGVYRFAGVNAECKRGPLRRQTSRDEMSSPSVYFTTKP